MTGIKAALKTVKTIQNFQPRFWIPIGVISTITKFVILVQIRYEPLGSSNKIGVLQKRETSLTSSSP